MSKLFGLYLLLASFLPLGTSVITRAQTTEPAPAPGSPVTMAVYYKVPPGKRLEWLTLYRKYHYPVMQRFGKDGLIKSVKIYQRRFRAEAPPCDSQLFLFCPDLAP